MPVARKPRKKPAKKFSPRLNFARRGEERAALHLEGIGYRIVARNWRSPETRNELDIVAEDGDCLVFVEVKAARSINFGDPITWITPRKQSAVIRAAESYISMCNPPHGSFRFDAITIAAPQVGQESRLVHTISAFIAS